MKKSAPKVKVGIVKRTKKIEKTRIPLELTQDRPDMQKRLKTEGAWSEVATIPTNYKANNLVLDPNEGFGRNKSVTPLVDPEERHAQQEETYSDDDELRAGCNQERKAGKAPPPRLTSMQKKIVLQLLKKHGSDTAAMVLDTKLNPMQHSAGQLNKLITGHKHWEALGEKAKHDFRGPQKPYKRL